MRAPILLSPLFCYSSQKTIQSEGGFLDSLNRDWFDDRPSSKGEVDLEASIWKDFPYIFSEEDDLALFKARNKILCWTISGIQSTRWRDFECEKDERVRKKPQNLRAEVLLGLAWLWIAQANSKRLKCQQQLFKVALSRNRRTFSTSIEDEESDPPPLPFLFSSDLFASFFPTLF